MMRIILVLFMLVSTATVYAQQTFNTTLLSNYTPPTRPFNPSADPFVDIWGYVAPDGSEYAIMGSDLGTHFINVTDPLNPVESDFVSGAFTGAGWRDFKTYGHYAYGVADVASHTLQIFDLQYLPDSVVTVYDSDAFSKSAHNIHVNKNRLYLISNTRSNGSDVPLDVLCIDDPANPTLIGGIWDNVNITGNYSTAHDAFVRNDTVYLSVYNNNF